LNNRSLLVVHEPPAATGAWQRALADAIRDPDQLIDRLGLPDSLREPARRAAAKFPVVVPHDYLERMQQGDPNDPLLRQVLPLADELDARPEFQSDAVGDAASRIAPGLLHKYAGRALMITTGTCAVHCRYCFRREYPYGAEPKSPSEWEPAFQAIENDPSIREVLLSGGDPLVLNEGRLRTVFDRLASIPHLRRVRIHSRLPIVLPRRVTDDLLGLLTGLRLTPVMVVHANHARELVGACADALRSLVRGGVTTLNQAVLLTGVNDTAAAQAALCERLVDLGVIPYYLHQLDRVTGTAHFEASDELGRSIVAELRRRLPGYAVPRLVREIAGEPHKTDV
jgi:EF-P beta-lysylation protein EpmB